jgi:hypothetical protein
VKKKFEKVYLTQGKYAVIDSVDYEKISKHKWFFHNNYARRWGTFNGKQRLINMHREILELSRSSEYADHVNGDTLDNRRCNLRVVNHLQNNCNRKCYSKSGYKGVYWSNQMKKWKAQICQKHLGYFSDKLKAASVYNIAAKQKYGEYARINKV